MQDINDIIKEIINGVSGYSSFVKLNSKTPLEKCT